MKKNGFTLVELMIYIGVSAIIMAAVYAAVVMAQRSSSSVGRKIITQQDARLVLDMMAMDIRNASYNRWHARGIWLDTGGNLLATDNGLYGIQDANQNKILVEMDLNEDKIIGYPGNNEAIYYKYNGVDTITRQSNFAGGDQVFFGGVGSGTLVHNAQAGVPLFQYFGSAGANNPFVTDPANPAASNPATPLPANQLLNAAINQQIRVIRITIVADTEANDSLTNAPKRMIYTTDVVVRNHAVATLTY